MQLGKQKVKDHGGSGVTEDSPRFRGNLWEWPNFQARFLVRPAESKPCPPKNSSEKQFSPRFSHTSSFIQYGCCRNNPVSKTASSVK